MERVNFQVIEKKWQEKFINKKLYQTKKDKKFYCLEMFPYPSGKIHMGHVRNYTIGDVIARFKFLKGFNVLHPMGWDSFGLPAENAAKENNLKPGDWTKKNILEMKRQLKMLGLSIDWQLEISTCDEKYYKYQQELFIDFYNKGLVSRKENYVNWDPIEKTVLANEQVINGRGWRSNALVERKKLSQWFFNITKLSNELLTGLESLNNWPEKVKLMQKNWIGKSIGCEIDFKVNLENKTLKIFTTRPDTIFGATFIAISVDHPLCIKLQNLPKFKSFREECLKVGTTEEALANAEKNGFNTGFTAVHPFIENKNIPIFVANFVLMDYGTGAIFGCPAHDQRDLDFAKKYDLDVIEVVSPDGVEKKYFKTNEAYTGDGTLINSDFLNELNVEDAKKKIINQIEEIKIGKSKTTFRLKDWGISRQRYWGCPIPMIYLEDGSIVPVEKSELPVKLPDDINLNVNGNPLESHPSWKTTIHKKTGKPAIRETDTLDTFVDSSWYFLRFCSPKFSSSPFDTDKVNYWMPVDQYVGGVEHAILHLLYSRFFTKALRDLNYINLNEPFKGLFTQGMVTHRTFKNNNDQWVEPGDVVRKNDLLFDKNNNPVTTGNIEKMSKSKKNIIDPGEIIDLYGADTARWFVLSDSPPERDLEWTETGVVASYKFINKIWDLFKKSTTYKAETKNTEKNSLKKFDKIIDEISNNIESFHFNKSVAKIYEYVNLLTSLVSKKSIVEKDLYKIIENLTIIIQPFIPHLSEEIWHCMGKKDLCVSTKWPETEHIYEESVIKLPLQINGRTRSLIDIQPNEDKDVIMKKVMMDQKILKNIKDKKVLKTIFVPNKIVNLVVK